MLKPGVRTLFVLRIQIPLELVIYRVWTALVGPAIPIMGYLVVSEFWKVLPSHMSGVHIVGLLFNVGLLLFGWVKLASPPLQVSCRRVDQQLWSAGVQPQAGPGITGLRIILHESGSWVRALKIWGQTLIIYCIMTSLVM